MTESEVIKIRCSKGHFVKMPDLIMVNGCGDVNYKQKVMCRVCGVLTLGELYSSFDSELFPIDHDILNDIYNINQSI